MYNTQKGLTADCDLDLASLSSDMFLELVSRVQRRSVHTKFKMRITSKKKKEKEEKSGSQVCSVAAVAMTCWQLHLLTPPLNAVVAGVRRWHLGRRNMALRNGLFQCFLFFVLH